MSRADVEVWISAGTLLVTVVGIGGLYAQIRSAAHSQARDHERQRKQATLDTYVGSVNQRQAIWSQLPNDRDVAAVRASCPSAAAEDDPLFKTVVAHLNYFENLAVGAEHDVYDTHVIDSLVGERLVAAWVAYEPFILDRRNLLGSLNVWCSFEALAKQLLPRHSNALWAQRNREVHSRPSAGGEDLGGH